MDCSIKSVKFHRYDTRCDDCGKHCGGWMWSYRHHFETMDGGDHLCYEECLLCHIKGTVHGIKYALKKIPKNIAIFFECWSYMTKLPWYSKKRTCKAMSLTGKLIRSGTK